MGDIKSEYLTHFPPFLLLNLAFISLPMYLAVYLFPPFEYDIFAFSKKPVSRRIPGDSAREQPKDHKKAYFSLK